MGKADHALLHLHGQALPLNLREFCHINLPAIATRAFTSQTPRAMPRTLRRRRALNWREDFAFLVDASSRVRDLANDLTKPDD